MKSFCFWALKLKTLFGAVLLCLIVVFFVSAYTIAFGNPSIFDVVYASCYSSAALLTYWFRFAMNKDTMIGMIFGFIRYNVGAFVFYYRLERWAVFKDWRMVLFMIRWLVILVIAAIPVSILGAASQVVGMIFIALTHIYGDEVLLSVSRRK